VQSSTSQGAVQRTSLCRGSEQNATLPLATIVASVASVTDMLKGILETGIATYDVEKARVVREEVENAIGLPEFWEIERQTVEAADRDFEGRHIAGHEGVDQTR